MCICLLFSLHMVQAQTEPNWSPDSKKIIFSMGRYPQRDMFIMNNDGKDVKQLTSTDSSEEYPTFSPDGKKILYCSNKNGYWELFIVDANGSNEQPLNIISSAKADQGPSRPNWSPDGKQIIYPAFGNGPAKLFIAGANGKNAKPFNGISGNYPCWSPDNDCIAYSDSIEQNIFIYTISTGKTAQLTKIAPGEKISAMYPSWSKDGNYIFFVENNNIFSIKKDGTEKKQLTNTPDRKYYPVISPDNKFIIYAKYDQKKYFLCRVNSDGTNPVLLYPIN